MWASKLLVRKDRDTIAVRALHTWPDGKTEILPRGKPLQIVWCAEGRPFTG